MQFIIAFKRAVLIAGVLVLSMCSLWYFFQTPPFSGPGLVLPSRTLDKAFTPRRKLDIAVALYHEDLHQLSNHLSKITLLPNIAPLNPKVTIYTKDPKATADSILDHVSADSIVHLPNRGREGGTYLSHIIENYDDLAEHTLFIQAEIHNFRNFLRRLEDYFVPETGMLNLGFGGITCNLTDCTDPWGWHDTEGHLPRMYTELYDKPAPSEAMVVSYKGQFVVSARRIRGMGRYYYEYLREMLESEKSPWSGEASDPSKKGGNAPVFGYTLERAWSLIFGCADGRIAVDCPGTWHTRRKGETDDTCQCLDDMGVE